MKLVSVGIDPDHLYRCTDRYVFYWVVEMLPRRPHSAIEGIISLTILLCGSRNAGFFF